MLVAPRWTKTIRFRLSLFFALTSFTLGSMLIGGLYQWQVSRLGDPAVPDETVLDVIDPDTLLGLRLVVDRNAAVRLEQASQIQALDDLKQGSLGALVVLFVASFGTSWWVAGMALRPVHRMTRVARDISASDVTRRINLPGPDDELKELGDTFDAMLDRLETGFEDQRRLVQDASHELRNPLAAARTNLDLVLSDPEASCEDLRHAAEVAQRATKRVATMVEELLIQARSGVPELAIDDVDLADVAGDVVEEYRGGARQRRITLALDVRANPVVRGDGSALRRAVGNLVSNAIKASPSGASIEVVVATDHRSRGTISVVDRGPGLSDEDQERAFERFWRGPTSHGGAGLGLSIVRHVVDRHGGEVSVASEPGMGATFTIGLPTGRSGPDRPPARRLSEAVEEAGAPERAEAADAV